MPITARSAPWTLTARLDGADISAALTGEVRIDIEEGAARTATIEIDVSGVISPDSYTGKALEIDVNYEAQVLRRFTGRVDRPRVQPFVGAITLEASDARSATLNGLTHAQIDAQTGHVPNAAFVAEGDTGDEYAEAALAETLSTLELDEAGGWRLVPLSASAAADWSYDGGDILDGSFVVDLALADELDNDLTVEVTAQRERYWSRRANCNWNWQYTFIEYLARSRTLPNESMFRSTAEGIGWYVHGYSFDYLPGSGLYYNDTGAKVPDGTVVSGATPTTAFSNPFKEILTRGQARIEDWWTQRVNLAAAVRLTVPTSIAAHGAHARTDRVRRAATSTLDWENGETPEARLDRPATTPVPGGYLYADSNALVEDSGLLGAAVARGVRKLFGAHRRNTVQFTTAFHGAGGRAPDTSDTVRVEYIDAAGRTNRAQGKVVQVRERFSFQSNEAETTLTLALCRGGDTAVTVPTHDFVAPVADAALPTDSGTDSGDFDNQVSVLNQLGNEGGAVYDDTLDGYSGNWGTQYLVPGAPLGPLFPVRIRLSSPEIPASYRDTTDAPLALAVAVQLPQDLLEMEA